MTYTNGTAEDEQTIESTNVKVLLGLLLAEGTRGEQQVTEGNGNGTVDVEDKGGRLLGGHVLDGESIVESAVVGEVLLHVVHHEVDTQVGVGLRLDLVADTGNELVGLAHRVNKLSGGEAGLLSAGELASSIVKGTTETATDGEKTRDQGRDQVLAGTGGDDTVHRTGHGGSVVGSELEDHLDELAGVWGQASLEPKERDDTTDTDLLLEDVGDAHTRVHELLATLVGDGRDESSGLSDETKLGRPLVVHRDVRGLNLSLRHDDTGADELLVCGLEGLGEVLEGVGDDEASGLHGAVLGIGSLHVGVGHGTGVTELHLGGEHLGTSTDSPSNDGLLDLALLDSLDDSVLLGTTDLTEQQEHLAARVGLVSEQVVDERGTGVSVTTDGDTLVDTVGGVRKDVVELVRHATRLGDVANRSGSVQLAGDKVVHHTTGVTDTETSGLDATNGSGADDYDALGLSEVEELSGVSLRDTLSNYTDRLDLGIGEDVESSGVDRSGRSKVDNNVDVRVLLDRLSDRGVHRQEGLLGAPVELLDVVATEGVDHGSDRRGFAAAGEVKVEHALDGSWLQTEDEGAGSLVEGTEPGASTVLSVAEADDVVVGLLTRAISLDGADGVLRGAARGLVAAVGMTVGVSVRGGSDGPSHSRGRALDAESHGHDGGDGRLGAVNLHEDTDRLSTEAHGLETLLVVGTGSSNPNLDAVADEAILVLLQGADDTLEGGSDVGEVGGTSTDDEDLAVLVGLTASHQIDDGLGVLVGLTLGRSTRVLAVVGELVGKAGSGDGVRVDDRRTTTSYHGPDTTGGVQHGELERSTGRCVELLDVCLLLGQVTTERCGPNHGGSAVSLNRRGCRGRCGDVASDSPLGAAEEVCGLVELGGHVEVVDLGGLAIGGIEADEGVDLEVGEVKVNVDRVETDKEVAEDVLLGGGNVSKESSDELLARGELGADGQEELESLGVDIANLNTTLADLSVWVCDARVSGLLSEENPVALTSRVDANVVLGLCRVGAEWLDDEGVEGTGGLLNCHGLAGALLDPSSGRLPCLVEAQETGLSSALDELVGLADKLGGEDPVGQASTGLDGGSENLGGRVPGCQQLALVLRMKATHHSTCATRTGATVDSVLQGMGVGERGSQ